MPKFMNNNASERTLPDNILDQVLESFPEPVFLINPAGDILKSNSAFASAVDAITRNHADGNAFAWLAEAYSLPDEAGRLRSAVNDALQTQQQIIVEEETPDHTWNITINPVHSSDMVADRLLVMFKDISGLTVRRRELELESALQNALLNAMPGCAAIFDENGKLLLWNQYARNLVLGSSEAQNQSHIPHRIVSANDLFPIKQKFQNIVNSGYEDSGEIRMRPPGSQHDIWLATRGRQITINGQKCIVAAGVDITEQKIIEEELQKNRTRFCQALEAARAGVWEWNLKTGTMIWSDEMWPLYGLDKDNNRPSIQLWENLLHAESNDTLISAMHKTVERSDILNIEYRITLPDGSVRWIMARGMPLKDDDNALSIDRFIGTSIDITERKELENELVESKIRFGYALDAAHSGIWEWNVETDEMRWSEQVWGLYGLAVDSRELNHELCVASVHPDDRETTSQLIKSALQQEHSAAIEYRVCHPDGSIHWLTSRGMPLHDSDGRLIRYIGTIIDITERKQTEIALIESRTRLGQALEAARAGVWEWDLKTGENIWSDEIWQLYGLQYNEAPPSFELWKTTIYPKDVGRTINAVTRAARHETALNVEYRVCYADGSVHWLMSRGRPLRDQHGRVVRYIGTVIDITERKKMEQELKERKARFKFALEATNAGVWEWDLNTDQVIWSDRIWALYGLEADSLPHDHKLCQSTVHKDDRDATFQIVMAAAAQDQEINIEYRVCHPDGSVHWLACRGMPLKNTEGGMTRYIGTVMDISERKQIETALKENERKFRSIFDHAPVAISIEDIATAQLIDVNTSWLQLFGYSKESVLGKTGSDLRLYAEMSDYENISISFHEQHRIINKPLLLRTSAGGYINVLYSSEFITLKNKPVLLVMMTDITVQKIQQQNINQLEKAVTERTVQLQEEVERLQRFLSMISHEYRTPLAIIRTNLDLIKMKNRMGNFGNKEELFKINRAINRLVEVLEVSIEESRISESQKASPLTLLRIAPVITSQIEEIRNMWPERSINYSECSESAEVFGELSQIQFAIFNLLDNARKYSPPESTIDVGCWTDENEIVINIRNKGEWISQKEADVFFEKYHRGKNSVNTAGAGLGLWLVRNIITQHQGSVTIKATPYGAEAIVRLPLARS